MGLTQEEFAAIGGASKGSQSGWENGTAFPNAKFLAAITAAGADVGYILTGLRTPKPAVSEDGSEVRTVTPRKARILDLLDDLGDDAVRQVQDIVEKETRIKTLEEENAKLKRQA